MENFVQIVMYFMIYSVVGYLWEIFYCSLVAREFKNRGFLFGPYLPLWGLGAILMLGVQHFLHLTEWWQVFLMAVIVCDSIEYFASYIMEKIFNLRWWDYTDNKWLSLNGRISFETSLGFGVGGLLLLSILQPAFRGLLDLLPFELKASVATVLAVIMIIDICLSSAAAKRVEMEIGAKGKGAPRVDLTTEIKKFSKAYYSKRVRKARKARKSTVKHIKKLRKQVKRSLKKQSSKKK